MALNQSLRLFFITVFKFHILLFKIKVHEKNNLIYSPVF
jgi:hypothetical protein